MTKIIYDQRRASRLLPLLGAIGREIQERTEALDRLEKDIARLSAIPYVDTQDQLSRELQGKLAEASAHRRGLRLAKQELDRLGCSVVGTEPLTIRIPGRVGEALHSFVWQNGDPVLQ